MAARKNQPTTQWVPIADLKMDRKVNTRPLKNAKVSKYVDEFDADAIGYLEISERANGDLIILDGQHRVEALRRLGWDNGQKIEAKVHNDLTTAQEAHLFALLNDETPVTPIHKMLARIEAGDEPDASIDKIVRSVGLRISDQVGDGKIVSAAVLRKIWFGGRGSRGKTTLVEQPELLRSALRLVCEAWGKRGDALRGEILLGTALFLSRYEGISFDRDKLVHQLSLTPGGPLGVVGDARALASIHSTPVATSVAAKYVLLYHKGRKTNRLDDWFSK